VDALSRAVEDICRRFGPRRAQRATTPQEEAILWKARRSISGALGRIGRNKLGEDICVPRSQVPEMARQARAIAKDQALPLVLYGHIGDGNLHPNFVFDLRDAGQVERMWRGVTAIAQAALALGGSISGEHGIGLLKRSFLPDALDPAALAKMRAIRRHFDPQARMNRDKVFQPGSGE
jgi:FAD/FMN-containing dehydrogenase